MKMKKLAFICMTIFLLATGASNSAFAATVSGSCGDSCTYSYDDVKKVLTIQGSGEISETPWKSIKTSVQSIVVGEGITSIGIDEFKDFTALTSVSLPQSLTEISYEAFRNCTALKSITIPKNVTSSGLGNCFSGSGLETITFEEGFKKIDTSMFRNCDYLKNINFPSTLTEIGVAAFENCTALANVNLPDSLTGLSIDCFKGCTALKSITIPKNVTSSGLGQCFVRSGLETVTFADGMQKVPSYMFENCTTLKNIYFPNTLKKIETGAFSGCTSLTEVTLPWYLEEIGWDAFKNCSNLIKVTIYQKVNKIDSSSFAKVNNLTIYGKKGSTAQKFAKENNYKFATCKIPALKGITYKKGNLKYKVVKDYIDGKGTVMVTGLSKKASSVTIPDKVKLESYNYKVVKVDKKAFYKQSKLKKVTIKANSISSMGSKAFSKINSKATVTVPKKKYTAYKKLLKKAGLSSKVKIKKK